jgi:hypothetical protein
MKQLRNCNSSRLLQATSGRLYGGELSAAASICHVEILALDRGGRLCGELKFPGSRAAAVVIRVIRERVSGYHHDAAADI